MTLVCRDLCGGEHTSLGFAQDTSTSAAGMPLGIVFSMYLVYAVNCFNFCTSEFS